MLTFCKKLPSLAVIWLVLTVSYGCYACVGSCLFGPPMTVGTSASEAGISRYESGKVKSFELARYEDVVEATRRAGQISSLELRKEAGETNKTTLHYNTGENDKVTVLIERRTDTLTYIEVDVGLFGSKGLAIFVINQITHEIASEGKYLQEWSHQRVM